MDILFVNEHPISLELAYTSRIYHISRVLRNFGLCTIILPQQRDIPGFLRGNGRIHKQLRRVYVFMRMIHIIKKRKINYIISRGLYMGLFSVFLAKVFRLQSIFDFHGYVYQEEIYRGQKYKSFLTRFLEELCIEYSDYVVTQTESNRDVVKNLNKNVILIENGVDLKEFINLCPQKSTLIRYSVPKTKPIVGFIGNWEKWMNIEDLLEASKYIDNVSVVIVGEGRDYKKYINKYKRHRNIFFTGRVVHMEALKILANFDICVVPHSKSTIMLYKSARKTLEYMAAGKPIVVSSVIGKEQFLIEKVNCLTYEAENPEDLANKMKILIGNVHLRKKIGENNRTLAQNFTWERNLEKSGLVEILRSVFNKNAESL